MLHAVFKSSRGAQELCEVISDVNGLNWFGTGVPESLQGC